MGSKRSSKLRSSKKKKNKNKTERGKRKGKTLLDLPSDLLPLIISHLPLKDNIRASTVCKTWHEACVSARVINKSPWLIYFSKTNGSYSILYDPSMKKTYSLVFPKLSGFRVCYSKDGWLLMYNTSTFQLLFLNPFTRESIPVPSLQMAYNQRVGFSCAPTSTSCLLFTISNEVTLKNITIYTCSPNAKEWDTFVVTGRPRSYNNFEQIVFVNGVFYCLTDSGWLWSFCPSSKTWTILPGQPPKCPGSNGCFMAEHQGTIFLIYMYNYINPTVLKLDHTSWEWTKRRTLGGLTIYASALSSELRAEQNQQCRTRNCLCVFHEFKKTCIYHNVDGHKMNLCNWKNHLSPYGNIWIMPPLNLLNLPFV